MTFYSFFIVVGNITSMLKAKDMWTNTLIVASSDNGGPLYDGPSPPPAVNGGGGNNHPLVRTRFPLIARSSANAIITRLLAALHSYYTHQRGGKLSDWEGGVRVNVSANANRFTRPSPAG